MSAGNANVDEGNAKLRNRSIEDSARCAAKIGIEFQRNGEGLEDINMESDVEMNESNTRVAA